MSNNVFSIPYGEETISIDLPDGTRVIQNTNKPLTAIDDVAQAVRDALNSPIAHDPLSKLVNSKSRVTIAFDDRVNDIPSMMARPHFKKVALKVVLEELDKIGVDSHNVRLVSAIGLHPKSTTQELACIVGEKLAYYSNPSKVLNHDAHDEANLVYLGETERYHTVEVNRLVAESDQLIYVGEPDTMYNGGWKSVTVGLTSWRSISFHHRPYPEDIGKSRLQPGCSFLTMLNEMGAVIERELAKKGRRVLIIEGTKNNALPPEIVRVVAGHPPEAHAKSLEILEQQQLVDVIGQTDVLMCGLANSREHYSKPSSFVNPILIRNLATQRSFGYFYNMPLVKQGGIIIACHPCLRQFDEYKHPSYIELFEKVITRVQDPIEVWDLYAEDFACRPDFLHKYRYSHAFHGAHPIILWAHGLRSLGYISSMFLAGATDFEAAKRVGFEPFASLGEAIAEAKNRMGSSCSFTYLDMSLPTICNVKP